ncbi:MAG: hypothetical protein U0791_20555 [Gemmataceae bacterium]
MGRLAKSPGGQTKTVLLRRHQIDRITEMAERLGCDSSDIVRSSLDLLASRNENDVRARTAAALERNRRLLESISWDLIPIVLRGWAGDEMLLPMKQARSASVVRLVDATAKMLKRLWSPPPRERVEGYFPTTGFENTADDLLTVLASPATRILQFPKRHDTFPLNIAVAQIVCDAIATSESPIVAERQYEQPSSALKRLLDENRITEVSESLGVLAEAFSVRVFQVDKSRCRLAGNLGRGSLHEREQEG